MDIATKAQLSQNDSMHTKIMSAVKSAAWRRIIIILFAVQLVLIGVYLHSGQKLMSMLDLRYLAAQTPVVNANVKNLDRTFLNDLRSSDNGSSSDAESHTDRLKVAIGLGITTAKSKFKGANFEEAFPFFRSLLKTFCSTCSSGFSYHFFLGYDYNDPLLSKGDFRVKFQDRFEAFVVSSCPGSSTYSIHFVECDHHRRPAWAQNDAMIEAYIFGVDYFYRINDDTKMNSPGWTQLFIDKLDGMSPPRVGVTGPKHVGGNTHILTYDFTHRTHVEIHGFYYPREFPDWYADRWITDVYKPGRSVKMNQVQLRHTMETGQRYKNTKIPKATIERQIEVDQSSVTRYVRVMEKGLKSADPRKIISLSLYGNESSVTWGTIRNCQLAPVIYPGWSVRVYVPKDTASSSGATDVRHHKILSVLRRLGAQIVQVDSASRIPAVAWSYLVADDPDVDVFLIREPTARLSERESAAVNAWLSSGQNTSVVHAIRDHHKYPNSTLSHGLLGAKAKPLMKSLGVESMQILLNQFVPKSDLKFDINTNSNSSSDSSSIFLRTLLENVLQKLKNNDLLWHDSVSCGDVNSRTVLPFPAVRNGKVFVGQTFSAHEQPTSDTEATEALLNRNSQCENPS